MAIVAYDAPDNRKTRLYGGISTGDIFHLADEPDTIYIATSYYKLEQRMCAVLWGDVLSSGDAYTFDSETAVCLINISIRKED